MTDKDSALLLLGCVFTHSVKTHHIGGIKICQLVLPSYQWTDLLNGSSQPLLAFHHFPEKDTCIIISVKDTITIPEANAISCVITSSNYKIKAKEQSQPVYSASQAEGEACRAVRLISGWHYGVGSRRKTAGQTHILGVAVRDTAGHRILVPGKRLLRFLFLELDTEWRSNAHILQNYNH